MVIGGSLEEGYKHMGISQKEVDQVESDVYSVIQLVAESQGKKISKKDLPKVTVMGGDSSSYESKTNTIRIAKNNMGNGETYASEVGHFLRSYFTDKIGSETSQDIDELKVEEFFDRSAYTIAREKAQGTELEPLFSGEIGRAHV